MPPSQSYVQHTEGEHNAAHHAAGSEEEPGHSAPGNERFVDARVRRDARLRHLSSELGERAGAGDRHRAGDRTPRSVALCAGGGAGRARITQLPSAVWVGRLPGDVCAAALREAQQLRSQLGHRWVEDGRPSRSTLNFGWQFVALEKGELTWAELPPPMVALREECWRIFHGLYDAEMPGRGPEDLDNMIITFYDKGDCIVPHVDRDDEQAKPYRFSEAVLGAVLRPDARGRIFWQRHERPDRASLTMGQVAPDYELAEEAGSAFLFRDEARHWPWYHGVTPVADLRVSVTLRHTFITAPERMRRVGAQKPPGPARL